MNLIRVQQELDFSMDAFLTPQAGMEQVAFLRLHASVCMLLTEVSELAAQHPELTLAPPIMPGLYQILIGPSDEPS